MKNKQIIRQQFLFPHLFVKVSPHTCHVDILNIRVSVVTVGLLDVLFRSKHF